MSNPILDFYAYPDRINSAGFCFNDIFRWTDEELELRHTYIQWFFPTSQESACWPNAPVLNVDELIFFSISGRTRRMQRKAFARMMKFYGIDLRFFGRRLIADISTDDLPQWITETNHNYLRITRILTSLKLFGNNRQAKKLLDALIYNQRAYNNLFDTHWYNRHGGGYATEQLLFPEISIVYWAAAVEFTDVDKELEMLWRKAR